LENVLERSILFTNGNEMTNLDLELPTEIVIDEAWKSFKQQTVTRTERSFFESILKQHQGDIKKVAEQLGISSRAVYQKLKKYDLNLQNFRS
jgi:two-component system response regulator HydG